MQFFRHNLLLIVLLLIGAVVFTIYGCPYFRDQHHGGLCILVYALLVLALVYGRAMRVKRREPRGKLRPD